MTHELIAPEVAIIPVPPSVAVGRVLIQAMARPVSACAIEDPNSNVGPSMFSLWLLEDLGQVPALVYLRPDARKDQELLKHIKRLRAAKLHFRAPEYSAETIMCLELVIIEDDIASRTLRIQLVPVPRAIYRVYQTAHLLHPWYSAEEIQPEVT